MAGRNRSRRPTGSGLQRTSCRGKRGDGVAAVLWGGVRQGGRRVRLVTCSLCCSFPGEL